MTSPFTAFPIPTLLLDQGSVTAAGGTTSRTLASRFSDTFNVKDFGALGNGTTDDTSAIQAAINYASGINGGVIRFGPGTYVISSTLLINHSNIHLVGSGSDGLHDGGSGASPATILLWVGGASPMVKFATVYGVGSSVIGDCRMYKIAFNGQGDASIGLLVDTVRKSTFDNLYVSDVLIAAYKVTCGVTGTDTAEAADVQDCLFARLSFRLIDSVPVQAAHGFLLTGSSNANTSFNTFLDCGGQHYDGAGWNLDSTDNNKFLGCHAFNVGGTGYDFDHGANANTNYFLGCSWGNTLGFIVRTPAVGNNSPSQILTMDRGNSSQDPVLETGASIINPLGPWTSYTPTVTALGGTLTTLGAVTGSYLLLGKTIQFTATIPIVTNGTASGGIFVTVPIGSPSTSVAIVGQDISASISLTCRGAASDNRILVQKYDGTYPGANGKTIVISGTYQIN